MKQIGRGENNIVNFTVGNYIAVFKVPEQYKYIAYDGDGAVTAFVYNPTSAAADFGLEDCPFFGRGEFGTWTELRPRITSDSVTIAEGYENWEDSLREIVPMECLYMKPSPVPAAQALDDAFEAFKQEAYKQTEALLEEVGCLKEENEKLKKDFNEARTRICNYDFAMQAISKLTEELE